jgi:hypothetical protein
MIAGAADRKVICLSGTCEGKKHDKKISDEENQALPDGSILFKDAGFQGYEPADIICYQPVRKASGKELPAEDRIFNRMISGVRVIAEHVIAGVKRLHVVSDVFRNRKKDFDDIVTELACGLHNLRVSFRETGLSKKDSDAVWH